MRWFWTIFTRALFVLLILWSVLGDPSFRAAEPVALNRNIEVIDVMGEAQIHRKGQAAWVQLRPREVIQTGDEILVGNKGRVRLREGNRTILTLAPGTRYGGDEGWVNRIKKGLIYFFSREKPGEIRFLVPAYSGISSGTEYVVRVGDDGHSEVYVLEGGVVVRNEVGVLDLKRGDGVSGGGMNQELKAMKVGDATALVNWCLHYPMVLCESDLTLTAEDRVAFKASVEIYRVGDYVGAWVAMKDQEVRTAGARLFGAALRLAAGRVEEAEDWISQVRQDVLAQEKERRLAVALSKLSRTIRGLPEENERQIPVRRRMATETLVESYELQSRGKLNEALHVVEEASEIGDSSIWVRWGELLLSFGETRKAESLAEKALKQRPRDARALVLRGFVCAAQNRISQARESFEKAVLSDGSLADGWLGLGLCLVRQGDSELGLRQLEVAAAVQPHRGLFRSYLGKAFVQAGELKRAAAELDFARDLDPEDPTAWLYSALLAFDRGDVNRAILELQSSEERGGRQATFRSAHLLDQDRAVRGVNLARMYADAGLSEVGFAAAVRAVAYDQQSGEAYRFLADAYAERRDANQINLRYDTVFANAYMLANLLSPVGAGPLSPAVSQQEYSKLFEQDGLHFTTGTEYRSDGSFQQNAVQYGLFGNMSYSVEATYRRLVGHYPNDELEDNTVVARWKQQVSTRTTLLLEASAYHLMAGDLARVSSAEMVDPTLRVHEDQKPGLRMGGATHWSSESSTVYLLGYSSGGLDVETENGVLPVFHINHLVDTIAPEVSLRYTLQPEVFSGEIQQWLRTDTHTTVAGVRFQALNLDLQSSLRKFASTGSNIEFRQQQKLEFQSVLAGAYAYDTWKLRDDLSLIGGLSWETMEYPDNFRFQPLSESEHEQSRLLPRAGIFWRPSEKAMFRLVYGRALGGVVQEQGFRVEPAQVLGFPIQSRGILPADLVGTTSGEQMESLGVAWDGRLGERSYVSLEATTVRSVWDGSRGVVWFDYAGPGTATYSTTPVKLDFREQTVSFTLAQMMGRWWTLGWRSGLEMARLASAYPQATESEISQSLNGNFQDRALAHEHGLFAVINHSAGWYSRGNVSRVEQWNMEGTSFGADEVYWKVDLEAGYRWNRRKADLALGLLNLADQHVHHVSWSRWAQDMSWGRTLVMRLRLSF